MAPGGDVLFKSVEVDVDTDGDGLADKAEAYYETNSTRVDTDGDGYSDGEEVLPLVVIPRMRILWATGHPPETFHLEHPFDSGKPAGR